MKKVLLVSGCLVGLQCRYDGGNKYSEKIPSFLKAGEIVVVCPEVLAGLPIPRPACEIVGGDGHDVLHGKAKVIGIDGKDYTQDFIKGAKKAVTLAIKHGVTHAYLREKSPSCGVGTLYDGNSLKNGNGVFAALLQEAGIIVESV